MKTPRVANNVWKEKGNIHSHESDPKRFTKYQRRLFSTVIVNLSNSFVQ